ncbi:MerR family transcriptional regulator [Paenibacillus sp. CC-CFT747]|nr:MerR family transcriptional regulator [Paenibacillus sp. CC-CFT747]
MENRTWKVGEVAKRTGLTIRTLHHYDRIGLLSPTAHTESGHRLYTGEDLIRLHQALSLKELGFSLEEIKDMTSQTELPWTEMVKLQIQRLEERIDGMTGVRDRLRDIAETMETASTQPPVSSDAVLKAIQLSRMMNSPHFLPGQAREMKTRLKTAAPVRQKQEGRKIRISSASSAGTNNPEDCPMTRRLPLRRRNGKP